MAVAACPRTRSYRRVDCVVPAAGVAILAAHEPLDVVCGSVRGVALAGATNLAVGREQVRMSQQDGRR